MSTILSKSTKAPFRGEPLQFDRNGQTLTVEWNYYPAEPSNGVEEEVTVVGIYDIHNDELALDRDLYALAEKAIWGSKVSEFPCEVCDFHLPKGSTFCPSCNNSDEDEV